jgi:hypothetical protein
MIAPLITSGIGQLHTNEPDPKKPNKILKPYLTIGFDEIRALVDNPQQLPKAQAQWVIPSTLPSRNFKEQEQNGEYWALWADLDKNPPSLSDLADIVEDLLDDCDFELYNSRSATPDNQKARGLIFLDKPLCYADWRLAQEILNDKLEALGVVPDRANERSAQVCYLPNKGEFYRSDYARNENYFDPMSFWAQEITTKRETIQNEALALEAAQQSSMAKREALTLPDSGLSDFEALKNAFNQAYTPHEWMIQAGYAQRGESFRHPFSESGNYSATCQVNTKGELRVNALSSSDRLYTNGAGAHDSFSVYTTLFHNGDTKAAQIEAGDKLLAIGCVSWNKSKQLEWAKQQEQSKNQAQASPPHENDERKEIFDFSQFSINEDIEAMKKSALEQVYLLDGIALVGQVTVIYAKPNTGKTLLLLSLLIDSVLKGRIKGSNIHYVNADDDYNGMLNKAELLTKHEINTVTPGYKGFEPKLLTDYMRRMVETGNARGQVIALDTLKKFTEVMDKKISSDFMRAVGEFISHGGSIILLAHTNKNRSAEGKVVAGGTSDISDDASCAYTLDETSDDGHTKQVLFENIKMRGNVVKTVAYSYDSSSQASWLDRFNSIKKIDDGLINDAKKQRDIKNDKEKDQDIIEAFIRCINYGIITRTALIDGVREETGLGRGKVIAVLNKYTGTAIDRGNLWKVTRGLHGSVTYSLLSSFNPASSEEYREVRDGLYM